LRTSTINGFADTFPTFRAHQGGQTRADADRERTLTELEVKRRMIESRHAAPGAESARVTVSQRLLESSAIPASRAAVDAALEL
jgi:hypothetical protein